MKVDGHEKGISPRAKILNIVERAIHILIIARASNENNDQLRSRLRGKSHTKKQRSKFPSVRLFLISIHA